MTDQKLKKRERDGWQVLSAGADAARDFYEGVPDEHVVWLLRGGIVLDSRAGVVQAMSGPPCPSML